MEFTIVQWPEIQNYMEKLGFDENAVLINDEVFCDANGIGPSAYMVNVEWMKENSGIHQNEENEQGEV